MSLEILSKLDIKTTRLNKEELFTILSTTNSGEFFTKEHLENISISDDSQNEVIELIKQQKIGSISYSIDCEIANANDILNTLDTPCDYCSNSVVKGNHFIKELFTINDDIYEEFNNIKIQEFNSVIPKEYHSTFKKLKDDLINIVPFLGSGISIPIGLPSWSDLIRGMKDGLSEEDAEQFETYLNEGDIFSAIDILQNHSLSYRTETQIKEFISKHIEENIKINLNDQFHNINDLLNLYSDFYITTNYDTALSKYKQNFMLPFVLNDIENMQTLLKEKKHRIIHLHGISDRNSTMIFTKKDYEKVYNDEKNKRILSGIMSSKSLLFIGFSFTDKYFKDLYEILKNQIGGTHYIILADLHPHKAKQLIDIGLEPIGINVMNSNLNSTFANEYNDEYTQRFVNSLKILVKNLID